MKRIWVIVSILAGIVVIGGAGYLGMRSSQPAETPSAPEIPNTVEVNRCDVEQSVTAPGTVVNLEESEVRMPVDGQLAEILVQAGEMVQASDVLATLQPDPVQVARAQVALVEAQKKLASAQSVRALYNNTTSNPEAIAVARANLTLAEQQLTQAQAAYDEVSSLPTDDPGRAMALLALDGARALRRSALDRLNSTQNISPNALDIALADANLALAQANLEKAQEELELANSSLITAPFDGMVLEVKAATRQPITAGTDLFLLHDPKDIEVRVTVVEEDLPTIAVGQRVELYFDALPELEAKGMVSRILPQRVGGDRPLYYVYIQLEQAPEHLVAGMTADAAILIAERLQVLCLPRALVRASSGSSATVKVWNGLSSEERLIEIGLRGDVYIEILSGLAEGEQVVTK